MEASLNFIIFFEIIIAKYSETEINYKLSHRILSYKIHILYKIH